jgi:inner membrane protein
MDSLTQFALGASVALAVIGRRGLRRSAAWKIALIGGILGTLPDLDAFIDFGDAISNMIRHRAESHGLFYLTVASPPIAWCVARLHGGSTFYLRWCAAVWLVFITHVVIDWLTIYGTQLAQPFSDHPFGVGSMFVIDPLYTLPLIVGTVVSLLSAGQKSWRWNAFGLVASTAYIVWGLAIHQHAVQVARKHPATDDASARTLVTAAPLNTLLWRAVVVTPTTYYEGWYSLLDSQARFVWKAYPRNAELIEQHKHHPDIARVARFSHGFFKVDQVNNTLFVTDLRLGLEPFYSFRFDLGDPGADPTPSQRVGVRPNLSAGLPWLWDRMIGNPGTLEGYLKLPRS